VFFIDASRKFAEGKNQNKLRDEDIQKIVATWRARQDVPKYAHLATPAELKDNDYNLNIPLYVDTFEEEAPIDLKKVRDEIARLELDLTSTRDSLRKSLEELGVPF